METFIYNGLYTERLPSNKVIIVKTIGEDVYPMGKLALLFNLEAALKASRQRYIILVTPSVAFLIAISLIISARAQRKALRPLNTLIETMDSVVDDKTYDVKVEEGNKKEIRDGQKQIKSVTKIHWTRIHM